MVGNECTLPHFVLPDFQAQKKENTHVRTFIPYVKLQHKQTLCPYRLVSSFVNNIDASEKTWAKSMVIDRKCCCMALVVPFVEQAISITQSYSSKFSTQLLIPFVMSYDDGSDSIWVRASDKGPYYQPQKSLHNQVNIGHVAIPVRGARFQHYPSGFQNINLGTQVG